MYVLEHQACRKMIVAGLAPALLKVFGIRLVMIYSLL